MMRAVRFAAQLDFDIYPETFDAIARNKERISIVSRERVADELRKMVRSGHPSKGFLLLEKSGLLQLIFPELQALNGTETIDGHGHKDNFAHTLQVLDNVARVSDNEWLRWAAILHDIAKPSTKRYVQGIGWTFHNHNFIGKKMIPGIFKRMRLPMNEKNALCAEIGRTSHEADCIGRRRSDRFRPCGACCLKQAMILTT